MCACVVWGVKRGVQCLSDFRPSSLSSQMPTDAPEDRLTEQETAKVGGRGAASTVRGSAVVCVAAVFRGGGGDEGGILCFHHSEAFKKHFFCIASWIFCLFGSSSSSKHLSVETT